MEQVPINLQADGSAHQRLTSLAIPALFGIGLLAVLAEVAMVTVDQGSVTVRDILVLTASLAAAAAHPAHRGPDQQEMLGVKGLGHTPPPGLSFRPAVSLTRHPAAASSCW